MKNMSSKALDNALKAIAKNHPLVSVTDREALDTALWFGSKGMHKWVREHQETHPEAYRALEYVAAMKADPVLFDIAVDTGVFVEGLYLLMDEARRDFAFGARMSPTFHNILCSGREVGIPDEQIQELVKLIDGIGSFLGVPWCELETAYC